jgi:hypothetical protein
VKSGGWERGWGWEYAPQIDDAAAVVDRRKDGENECAVGNKTQKDRWAAIPLFVERLEQQIALWNTRAHQCHGRAVGGWQSRLHVDNILFALRAGEGEKWIWVR